MPKGPAFSSCLSFIRVIRVNPWLLLLFALVLSVPIRANPRRFVRLPALCLPAMLDPARIAELLRPFLGDTPVSAELAPQLQTYLELLLRWNTRINLTAVRAPEQIVTRHFGESLFAARLLRDAGAFTSGGDARPILADVGSGAGFPGLPIKLLAPHIRLTLIESQNKKATFLREVVRALGVKDAEVHCGRAETWKHTANVVTTRAVEKFATILPIAARLVVPHGRLCLLAGASQVEAVSQVLGARWNLSAPVPMPLSESRVVLMGVRAPVVAT